MAQNDEHNDFVFLSTLLLLSQPKTFWKLGFVPRSFPAGILIKSWVYAESAHSNCPLFCNQDGNQSFVSGISLQGIGYVKRDSSESGGLFIFDF
jgi:hypothetical protein